jgi:hypothetical protein
MKRCAAVDFKASGSSRLTIAGTGPKYGKLGNYSLPENRKSPLPGAFRRLLED